MQGPYTLQESNLDRLAFMPRPEFKRFAKHYLGKRFDRNIPRHDLQLSDGKTEFGLETMLRQMGLTGDEPVPDIRMSGLGNDSAEDRQAAASLVLEQRKRDSELTRLKGLNWQQLRAEARERHCKFTPSTKKPELLEIVLEKCVA